MSSIDIFVMAVRNLLKRKTRTFLTILGVIIGTAAIVIMVSLGLAMNKTFDEQLQMLGDITIVSVYKPYDYGRYGGDASQRRDKAPVLDNNAIEMFRKLPGVLTASAILETEMTASSGKYSATWMRVVGLAPDALTALGYTLQDGRFIEKDERNVILYGPKMAYQFYDMKKNNWWYGQDESLPAKVDPMSDKIKYSVDPKYRDLLYGWTNSEGEENDEVVQPPKTFDLKCVGILAPKDYNTDYAVVMDIDRVRKLIDEADKLSRSYSESWGYNQGTRESQQDTGYDRALVKCTDLDSVKKVSAKLTELGYPNDIPSSSLDSMKNIADSLQTLLSAIGSVSFLVAALGIANTMVTAIYERTREIGIMKVIGATLKDIKKLFLTEAALIGFIGGVVGVGVSIGVSYFMNTSGMTMFSSINEFAMQTTVSLITPELCGLAVLFSTLMGLVSGYFPALRAMRLSALSAIRTE